MKTSTSSMDDYLLTTDLNALILSCKRPNPPPPEEVEMRLSNLVRTSTLFESNQDILKKIIHTISPQGIALIHAPLFNDNIKLLELLFKNGADINLHTRQELKRKTNTDNKVPGGNPLLHTAAIVARKAETIKRLCEFGANIESLNERGQSAIECSLSAQNIVTFTELLLQSFQFPEKLRDGKWLSSLNPRHRHRFRITALVFNQLSSPFYDTVNMLLVFGQHWRQSTTALNSDMLLKIFDHLHDHIVIEPTVWSNLKEFATQLIDCSLNLKTDSPNHTLGIKSYADITNRYIDYGKGYCRAVLLTRINCAISESIITH